MAQQGEGEAMSERKDFAALEDLDQCIALAAFGLAITDTKYKSLDEWGRANGKPPQLIWDEIMSGAGLPACSLPSQLRSH